MARGDVYTAIQLARGMGYSAGALILAQVARLRRNTCTVKLYYG
jgi:hypothetical protein